MTAVTVAAVTVMLIEDNIWKTVRKKPSDRSLSTCDMMTEGPISDKMDFYIRRQAEKSGGGFKF